MILDDRQESRPDPDPPIGLAKRYAWPKLEGLPAGTDWETTAPGDPDYEVMAGFMAAFEPPTAIVASRASEVAPIEVPVVLPSPAPQPVDLDSWISLAMRQRYSWPPLEGIECVDLLAEIEPDVDGLYSFADLEPPKPQAKGPALRPEIPARTIAPVGPAAKPVVRVEPTAKLSARVELSARPAPRIEPTVKPAARIEAALKAAGRIEPAVKKAAHIEQAPKPTAPVMPVTRAPKVMPNPAKEVVAAAAQDPPAGQASPAAPPAAQWLEILTAIRRDIQELRAEHRADLVTEAEARDAGAPGVARPKGGPAATADDATAKAAKARKTQAPAPKPGRKRKRVTPPKQDEWGFFDPDQCGFAALLAKLEEIEGDEPTTPEQS